MMHRVRRALTEPVPRVPAGMLTMGRHSYQAPTVHHYPGDTTRVIVGNFTSIADDVEMMPGGNHRPDWVTTFPLRMRLLRQPPPAGVPASKGDIVIGSDVWIGRGARILSGVRIGNGAVVAAYSVVTRDVRPYALVAGSPAVEKRRRFPDDVVDALGRIAWWEWPDERIVEALELFEGPNLSEFVSRFDPSPA